MSPTTDSEGRGFRGGERVSSVSTGVCRVKNISTISISRNHTCNLNHTAISLLNQLLLDDESTGNSIFSPI